MDSGGSSSLSKEENIICKDDELYYFREMTILPHIV